jgi:hypothetical protein
MTRRIPHCLIALIAVFTLLSLTPGAGAQFVDPGNSPGENVGSPGARRPGLLVQAGIGRYQEGPEITRPAPMDPEFRLNLLNDLLRNIFAQLNVLIPFLPDFLNPDGDGGGGGGGGGGGTGGFDDVVITEIAHDGNVVFVELLNQTGIELRLDGFRFSDGIATTPALPGVELLRNETHVVQLGGDTQSEMADTFLLFRVQSINSGELAIYNFRSITDGAFPLDDPNFMIDYIQWSDDDQDRDPPLESTAVAANLWSSIDFIPMSLANNAFRLNANAETRDNSRSLDFTLVPFADNTLGTPESQLP